MIKFQRGKLLVLIGYSKANSIFIVEFDSHEYCKLWIDLSLLKTGLCIRWM